MKEKLTEFDGRGGAGMVDVGSKAETRRIAVATGTIRMRPETVSLVLSGTAKKGDVLGVARVAAIQAAKRTSELIPLCHPVALTSVAVEFAPDEKAAEVHCKAPGERLALTGREMEALIAVQVALATVY